MKRRSHLWKTSAALAAGSRLNEIWIGVLILCLVAGCGGSRTEPVRISAAASARDALERIATDFQAETGIRVEINPGPSSTLATQIAQGAPADLFLSADEAWADELAKDQLVAERRDLLSNRLVLVASADSTLQVHDLGGLAGSGIKRLALAGAEVPAGRYARQALESAGVWAAVKDRVLEAGDVRAAVTYVARREADAGLVYYTDTVGDSKIRIVFEINPALHAPIRYPLVLVGRDEVRPEARRFYDYLGSEAAARVFRQAGFVWVSGE